MNLVADEVLEVLRPLPVTIVKESINDEFDMVFHPPPESEVIQIPRTVAPKKTLEK
jgi:hypothetical protein